MSIYIIDEVYVGAIWLNLGSLKSQYCFKPSRDQYESVKNLIKRFHKKTSIKLNIDCLFHVKILGLYKNMSVHTRKLNYIFEITRSILT